MTAVFAILIGIVVVMIATSFLWRWGSRRYTIPCPSWLSWMVDGSVGEVLLQTKRTIDRMGIAPGMRILEIGPGPGRLLLPIARRVLPDGLAVGLELQEKMAHKLAHNARCERVDNLEIMHGDINKVSLPPNEFDLAFLCTVLGEIPDRASALAKVHASIRPGGRLSITEIIPDPHYQRRGVVRQLAETAGFEYLETLGTASHYTMNFRKPESA